MALSLGLGVVGGCLSSVGWIGLAMAQVEPFGDAPEPAPGSPRAPARPPAPEGAASADEAEAGDAAVGSPEGPGTSAPAASSNSVEPLGGHAAPGGAGPVAAGSKAVQPQTDTGDAEAEVSRPARDPLAICALVIACLSLVASVLAAYRSGRHRLRPSPPEPAGAADSIPSPSAPPPRASLNASGAFDASGAFHTSGTSGAFCGSDASDASGAFDDPVDDPPALPVDSPFGAAPEWPAMNPEPRPADPHPQRMRADDAADAPTAEGLGSTLASPSRQAEMRAWLAALEARLDRQQDVVEDLRRDVASFEQVCAQVLAIQHDLSDLRYVLAARSPLDDPDGGDAAVGPGAWRASIGYEPPPKKGSPSEAGARSVASLEQAPEVAPDEPPPVWVQRCPATTAVLDAIEAFTTLFSEVTRAVGDPAALLRSLWTTPDATELATEHRLLLTIEMAGGPTEAALLDGLRAIVADERRAPGPDAVRRWTLALDTDDHWRELAITWLQRRGPALQTLVEALPVEGLVGNARTAAETTRALTMRLEDLGEAIDEPTAPPPIRRLSDRMHRLFEQLARAGSRQYVAVRLYRDSVERLEHVSAGGPRPKLERFIAYAEVDRLPATSPPLPWSVDFGRGVVVRVARPIFAENEGRPGRVFFVPPRRKVEGGPDAAA